MTTVIDSDILIGLFVPSDSLHELATRLQLECQAREATIYLPTAILAEFATVASHKIGLAYTQQAVAVLEQGYNLVDVDAALMHDAIVRYHKQTTKKNSLFDCIVMATAHKLSVDCVFACDGGYKQNGFMLIEEYLVQQKA